MKSILQILIAAIFITVLSAISAPPALADERVAGASAQLNLTFFSQNSDKLDKRTAILRNYLKRFGSPLSEEVETFILTADRYNLDWTFLPAIAGVESTFGRRVPYNSYNPFGWANGTYRFDNWQHAIAIVGEALRRKYMDGWGVTTVEQIGPIYAPPSKTWARKVRFFMHEIKNFEKNSINLAMNLSF